MTGQTISHSEVLDKLGVGGMGAVYKARDTQLDRFVALKAILPGKVIGEDSKQRFVQEARAASALDHPNIITIYEISAANGVDFMTMEFLQGRALDRVIGRKGLTWPEALKHAVQIADALAAAHAAGIVHRDLKPGNVMITDKGLVKVLDFGLAKLIEPAHRDESEVTQTMQLAEAPRTEGSLRRVASDGCSCSKQRGVPRHARCEFHRQLSAGSSLRSAHVAQQSGFCSCFGAHSFSRYRRKHSRLQRHRRGVVPQAAVCRARAPGYLATEVP
jgi:serine/threonine protein kinase